MFLQLGEQSNKYAARIHLVGLWKGDKSQKKWVEIGLPFGTTEETAKSIFNALVSLVRSKQNLVAGNQSPAFNPSSSPAVVLSPVATVPRPFAARLDFDGKGGVRTYDAAGRELTDQDFRDYYKKFGLSVPETIDFSKPPAIVDGNTGTAFDKNGQEMPWLKGSPVMGSYRSTKPGRPSLGLVPTPDEVFGRHSLPDLLGSNTSLEPTTFGDDAPRRPSAVETINKIITTINPFNWIRNLKNWVGEEADLKKAQMLKEWERIEHLRNDPIGINEFNASDN